MKNKIQKIIIIMGVIILAHPYTVSADADFLPKVRVHYSPDGSVAVTYFVANSCVGEETETECMDRISSTGAYRDFPYDDMFPSELPQDRSVRDKWQGQKGKGIVVNHELVTKNEKIQEFNERLEEELEKDEPNPSTVLRLQKLIDKAKDIDHSVLSSDDLALFETKKKSILSSALKSVGDAVGSVFSGIKEGFAKLASLVTGSLQVGSPELPAGITVYDQKTREPNCVVVVDGKLQNIPGACQSDSQPVESLKDSEAPVIVISGDNPAQISVGTSYIDLGAVVSDANDKNPRLDVVGDVIDTSQIGVFTVTYTATDKEGNRSTAERIVMVGEVSVLPDGVNIEEDSETLSLEPSLQEEVNVSTTTDELSI